jgi:amidophosphoribosyltransferase
MCGIVGVVAKSYVNQTIFDALTVLQHRGQDAAGMVTGEGNRFFLRKDNGLVNEVFRTRHMKRLAGNAGIGHVRYPTAGSSSSAEAQPFYVNSPFGITLAHNGNLTNAEQLAHELFRSDLRHINTDSDSEILLNVLAHELHGRGKLSIDKNDIFAAVSAVHRRVRGAYAAVAMITGYGLLAFRDPFGIRPLVYGRRETEAGTEYMVSSESVAMDTLGFELINDIAPGEAVFIDTANQVHTAQCADWSNLAPCIFEYVYLARPDSIINGVSVHKARLRMGDYLGAKILREWPDHDIDVVIPIPESSRQAALQVAWHMGVKYREGFVKNRYIARTFIMPGQAVRKKSVRQKLNVIDLEFRDKNVLLVDDSIVRGTTSEQIVQMAREAGARKVYFASAAPPVRYPNVYGIDMPAASELVAHNRSAAEVAAAIGVDRLIFQDLVDLELAVNKGNSQIKRFDTSCFSGEYITGDIDRFYLSSLERRRSDQAKHQRENARKNNNIIDLHNAS